MPMESSKLLSQEDEYEDVSDSEYESESDSETEPELDSDCDDNDDDDDSDSEFEEVTLLESIKESIKDNEHIQKHCRRISSMSSTMFNLGGKALWRAGTTAILVLFPLMFTLEREEAIMAAERMQLQHGRTPQMM